MINVTIWNENIGQDSPDVTNVNPGGVHKTLEKFLSRDKNITVRTATLQDEDCGLSQGVIDSTDVLIWWGHAAHDKVPDYVAERVVQAVQKGMGFIALHSSHLAKPFVRLMGTTCTLKWRDNDVQNLWTILPNHPIVQDVPECIKLSAEEMYGERFDIPEPDELILLGWFGGGEVFRSGCVWNRGYGKVFYFQPGHETNPSYNNEHIQRIITNAVFYLAPLVRREKIECPNPPLESYK